jgi:ribulose-5-phosphate 4-epimerase/fuculose-1-phosphate aldolase
VGLPGADLGLCGVANQATATLYMLIRHMVVVWGQSVTEACHVVVLESVCQLSKGGGQQGRSQLF